VTRPIPTTSLFALLTNLKQLCNFDPASEQSSKLDALRTLLEALYQTTDKVIVFSQYVTTLEWLSQRLGDIEHDLYHGGLTAQMRDELVAKFEGSPGPRVFLMSLRAGGVGLNLQAASVVVLFDRWWNPAVEVQAIYRAHRFDRFRPLHAIRLLAHDTVEEKINQILGAKQAIFDEYVEQAPSAEVTPLTRAELLRILELRAAEID
jgi:SNF2 family DNA or RNA helicase